MPELSFRGTLYGCDDDDGSDAEDKDEDEEIPNKGDVDATSCRCTVLSDSSTVARHVEVWQTRPDGTYSSLSPGVQEGDCRASVPVVTASPSLLSFYFDTLAPGSTGAFGGLGAFRDDVRGLWLPYGILPFPDDIPPYGPPAIHFYVPPTVNDGFYYEPLVAQLGMNELEAAAQGPKNTYQFLGRDRRPHATFSEGKSNNNADNDNNGGSKFSSVVIRSVRRSSDGLVWEVEADFFLVRQRRQRSGGDGSNDDDDVSSTTTTPEQVFCSSSSRGILGWMRSFYSEPIAVCVPSLLGFFKL